ncbi:MAG: hypothetical protein ACRERC_19370 [Candidatus Binatia bacterium]
MRLSVPIGRRTFLRAGGMSAGMLALGRLRALPAACAESVPADGRLRVLGPRDAEILGAVAGRITFTGDRKMPLFGDTPALVTIDTALLQLPPDVSQQLSWALRMIEYGPPLSVGKFSTFTGLSPEWQDVMLMTWEQSSVRLLRIAFQAMKNLSMLGYYAQTDTWAAIHYQGPWIVRPPRVVGDAR